MRKLILTIVTTLSLQSVAQAESFLGKIGPFVTNETRVEAVNLQGCAASTKQLQFYVEQNGKYDIPRITVESLLVVYDSNQVVTFSGKNLGVVRGFTVPLDHSKGCPKTLVLTAMASGFNPGGSNTSNVEVWTK
jgi:hypothetical protein